MKKEKKKRSKEQRKKRRKRILILILVILIAAAAIFGIVVFAVPAAKISSYESELNMEDSPTAEYADLMADTDTVFSWAEDLADMGERRPGTEAGTEAQQYVYDKFIEFGLEDVQIVESDSTLYDCTDYSLKVNGETVECYYIGYTGISEEYGDFSDDVTGELVYVGDGVASDFRNTDVEGKIVICDVTFTEVPLIGMKLLSYLYYDPDGELPLFSSKTNPYGSEYLDAYALAMENGAAGFIGVLTNYLDSCTYNNEDLRYANDYEADLPGLWVSNAVGQELIEAAENGETAEMTLGGTFLEIQAGAVVGFVYGQSEETIMVESHYDSVTTGAAEDASGCAVMMAIADFYAQIPSENLERSVMFLAKEELVPTAECFSDILYRLMGLETEDFL